MHVLPGQALTDWLTHKEHRLTSSLDNYVFSCYSKCKNVVILSQKRFQCHLLCVRSWCTKRGGVGVGWTLGLSFKLKAPKKKSLRCNINRPPITYSYKFRRRRPASPGGALGRDFSEKVLRHFGWHVLSTMKFMTLKNNVLWHCTINPSMVSCVFDWPLVLFWRFSKMFDFVVLVGPYWIWICVVCILQTTHDFIDHWVHTSMHIDTYNYK